jgi:RNA polymerase sigma-70 factor (ECF subfamily)
VRQIGTENISKSSENCNDFTDPATNYTDMEKSDRDIKTEFARMLVEHQQIVHKICRVYCPRADDREDMFQEISVQLWRAYPGFRAEAKESTWIYRVALNVAISQSRRRKHPISQLTEATYHLPDFGPSEQSDEQLELLYKAIHALSEVEKALIFLYFENKTLDEIAVLSGISVGNVRVKMHRIREKLRTQLQPISSP